MLVAVKVAGLAVDQKSHMPYVVLEDTEGKRSLPIWIGMFEASAIATKLEGGRIARPMTHDLLVNVVSAFNGRLERVEVVDLKDNMFLAELVVVDREGAQRRVDCRPSDAIAAALRADCPIFVDSSVFERAGESLTDPKAASGGKTKEAMAEYLRNLSEDAFGKYKM